MISCDQDQEPGKSDTFEVTITGEGIDCKLPLIDFQEADLSRIEKITGSRWVSYHAYNLDKGKFNQLGQVLVVTVRKAYDSELSACTTLGPGYPWVTVTSAEFKHNSSYDTGY